MSDRAVAPSLIGLICLAADISNLVTRRVGPNLWSRCAVEPAMKGINHQWSSSHCGKECAAWIQMEATADDYEQKHKQTENQRVAVDPWAETTRTVTKYGSMKLR